MIHLIRYILLPAFPHFVLSETATALLNGLGATALSASSNAISSGVKSNKSYERTKRLMEKEQKMNRENFALENERQDWLNTNAASQQLASYKKAGLNPALMMDGAQFQTGGTSIGAVTPTSSPIANSSEFAPLANLATLPVTAKQLELMDSQKRNIDADTDKKTAETGLTLTQDEHEKIKAATDALMLDREKQTDLVVKEVFGSDANAGTLVGKNKVSEFDALTKEYLARMAEADWNKKFAEAKSADNKYLSALLDRPKEDLRYVVQSIALSAAQTRVTREQYITELLKQDNIASDTAKKSHEVAKMDSEKALTDVQRQEKLNDIFFANWYFDHDNKNRLIKMFGEKWYYNIQAMKEIFSGLSGPVTAASAVRSLR